VYCRRIADPVAFRLVRAQQGNQASPAGGALKAPRRSLPVMEAEMQHTEGTGVLMAPIPGFPSTGVDGLSTPVDGW
jgi:hypothetical protein